MMQRRGAVLFLIYSAFFHIGLLGIVDVILNFYFVSLGSSPETIGLLQSVPRLSGFLLSIPLGWLTDQIGKRTMIIWATVGAAISMGLLLIPTLPVLALSRFLFGLSYSAQQVANAPLMMALVEPKARTSYFSLYNVVTMAAMAAGSLIGGVLPGVVVQFSAGIAPPDATASATTPYAYGMALFVTGIITLLGLIPMLFVRAEHELPAAVPLNRAAAVNARPPWGLMMLLSLPMLAFGFTGGLTFPFYNLFFRESFAISDQTVGTILSIGTVGMALIPLISPPVERRIGRAVTLGIWMLVAAVAFFGLGLLPPLWLSVALFIVAIGFRNTMQPLFYPLMLEAVPTPLHNITNSVSLIMWNIGWFIAAAVGGYLQTSVGFGAIMQIVSVGMLLNSAAVVLIFRRAVIGDPPAQERAVE